MTKEELLRTLHYFEIYFYNEGEKIGVHLELKKDNLSIIVHYWYWFSGDWWNPPEEREYDKKTVYLKDIMESLKDDPSSYWQTIYKDLQEWCHVWECKNHALSEINRLEAKRSELLEQNMLTDFAMKSIDDAIDCYLYELEILDK